ncbi:hypothetical protein BHM03_00011304 [Ensete ventricosum]|nr:hypothetical protein BHM03_00011304 [Ensete ventricosum]
MTTSPRSFSPLGETFRLLVREKNRPRAREATARRRPAGCDGVRATRGQRRRAGEDDTRYFFLLFLLFLLLLPFFSLNPPLTVDFSLNQLLTAEIDRRRPKSTANHRFWRYRTVRCDTESTSRKTVMPIEFEV